MLNRNGTYLNLGEILNEIYNKDLEDNKHIKKFESSFSDYINVRTNIATDTGRGAIFLGLKAMNVGKGDEVIVQSHTFHGVIDAILASGADPVLVDISLEDYGASPAEIRKKITSKTKVIIATHLYGIPCEIEETMEVAQDNNIPVMEDCAHALGSKYNGKIIGRFGDMSIFSFDFDKPMPIGGGGILTVNHKGMVDDVKNIVQNYKRVPIIEEKKRLYALFVQHLLNQREIYKGHLDIDFGLQFLEKDKKLFKTIDDLIENKVSGEKLKDELWKYLKPKNIFAEKKKDISHYIHSGMNLLKWNLVPSAFQVPKIESEYMLMNSLRSLVAISRLKELSHVIEIRNKNAEMFAESLRDTNSYMLPATEKREIAYLKYNILNKKYLSSEIEPDALTHGFEMVNYMWRSPVHLIFPYNKLLKFNRNELKNCEYTANHSLNLPIHPYVTESDIEDMVKIMKKCD